MSDALTERIRNQRSEIKQTKQKLVELSVVANALLDEIGIRQDVPLILRLALGRAEIQERNER